MQKETIGAVTLDYRFYPGEDKYSDGGIEDEMLELAKSHDESEFDRMIAEKESWPILYHFSHVRRNILDWLPMTGEEHVLEIGAGPGAITGVLAEKAKDVTCIDLSRKRSLINAYRNRRHGNIRILVGNFQDIAESLEEKFDLITLIGVFEYAQFSIQSKQPFVDYLLAIKRLLAPGGRLVIAIENRLGLKYWAGATEDHTGVYFEGIEGYPTTDYVRTFSKPELEELFRQAGFAAWQFYYPYPDYKLPERIYSDDYLPHKGELNRNCQNLDRERIQVFSEERVYDSLIESGLYPLYSNSFMAIVEAAEESVTLQGAGQDCGWLLMYSKYSNERAEEFRIRTDILGDGSGKKIVRKSPASSQAGEHVASIYRKYEKLQEDLAGTGLSLNHCDFRDGNAWLEWLEGDTLEAELDALLFDGQMTAVVEKIRDYFQMFSNCSEEFRETIEFVRVFGKQKLKGGNIRSCRRISDIDMVFANVIHTKRGYELIDYEWTFEFPIPVKYLQYRCIYYYMLGNSRREELLREYDLYGAVGITEEEKTCFEDMEVHFQQYILGSYQPIWKLYDVISDGVIPVQPLIKEASQRRRMQTVEVYFDDGSGFHAANCRKYRAAGGGRTQLTIELPKGTKAVRIDPCSGRCIVRLEKLRQAGDSLACQTNGQRMPNGDYLFDTEDPQIVIRALRRGGREIQAVFYTEPLEGITREAVLSQDGRIRWMEQTKVWRMYRKVKRLLGKREY